jgi:anti-sigma factor RsiW
VSATPDKPPCEQTELVSSYVLGSLPPTEIPALEKHISTCRECRTELESLRPIVDSFVHWPTDVLRPTPSLWDRLARRIAAEKGTEPVLSVQHSVSGPDWEEVAPGLSCKVLAEDRVNDRVSLLVRLAPGASYPPHTHAGTEELHLLDGELWIDDRKLYPGDYNRGEPGGFDSRVWSETGCTCVLVTSTRDALRC